jgi:hypothetical protein
MDTLQCSTNSFIIKIWIEETAEETGQVRWRGHITHVPSGELRYVEDLDGIASFIAPYLEGLGVDLGLRRRAKPWRERFKLHLPRPD